MVFVRFDDVTPAIPDTGPTRAPEGAPTDGGRVLCGDPALARRGVAPRIGDSALSGRCGVHDYLKSDVT
jgi:hypothetical protein